MKRKKGLPSYPGSNKLYMIISVITLLEAISVTAQAIFVAQAVTSLFQCATSVEVFSDLVFFLLSFLSRHALALSNRMLAERFAEKMGTELRQQLTAAEALYPFFQQIFRLTCDLKVQARVDLEKIIEKKLNH